MIVVLPDDWYFGLGSLWVDRYERTPEEVFYPRGLLDCDEPDVVVVSHFFTAVVEPEDFGWPLFEDLIP